VEKTYHIAEKSDSEGLAEFLVKSGQNLLPMVELIEPSQKAVDDLIEVVGRATIEAVLKLSAQGVAGVPHPGKKGGAVGWHGRERGTVCLRERKLRVKRPRLRQKDQGPGGEVPLPAYEAMRANERLGSRMLEILLQGVSTRHYAGVLPQMAETVGVSKSRGSRQVIEASEEELRRLCERPLGDLQLLILSVDGLRFGEQQVLVAVGVDEEGQKRVLGLASGASESEVVVKGLLEDLVGRD
jgi:putative transposase